MPKKVVFTLSGRILLVRLVAMVTTDSGIVLFVRYALSLKKLFFLVVEMHCVLLRYDVRLKKEASIEHVIQHRTARWQHTDS